MHRQLWIGFVLGILLVWSIGGLAVEEAGRAAEGSDAALGLARDRVATPGMTATEEPKGAPGLATPPGSVQTAAAKEISGTWTKVAEGLEVGRFPAPLKSEVGDSVVTIVRVDPAQFELRLLSAKLLGLESNPNAEEWVARHGDLGVINAGMFLSDHKTSTGYMRAGSKENNGDLSKDNAVFMSRPKKSGFLAARLLDRTCENASAIASDYDVAIQGIRMVNCERGNTWKSQQGRWSTACVGEDGQGRILLVHVRSPYATKDLIDILLGLPIELKRLMYVEGGPEASLLLKVDGKVVVSEVGSFETGFVENDENRRFWALPNVIAVARR